MIGNAGAVKTTEGGTGQTTASPAVGAAGGAVPFTQASNLHREPIGYDNTVNLGSGATTLPVMLIPAYGYLRSVLLRVDIASTGGTPAFNPDAPFNAIADVALREPNGNVIYGPGNGYNAYLAQKYGGYNNLNDPKALVGYTVSGGNATFFLRIPLELSVADALGSLPNQNSSAQFQIGLNAATLGVIYSSAPTSATMRVRAYAEEWDQPATDSLGRANETMPPALNTTQFWTQQTYPIAVGNNAVRLTRIGNLIRNLVFVFRNAAGVRVDGLADQFTVSLDSQPLDIVDKAIHQMTTSERYGYFGTMDTAGALDTGVYPLPFTFDRTGKPGFETRNLWVPTLSQSRFEIAGTFATAGTLTVLTNDIVIANSSRAV